MASGAFASVFGLVIDMVTNLRRISKHGPPYFAPRVLPSWYAVMRDIGHRFLPDNPCSYFCYLCQLYRTTTLALVVVYCLFCLGCPRRQSAVKTTSVMEDVCSPSANKLIPPHFSTFFNDIVLHRWNPPFTPNLIFWPRALLRAAGQGHWQALA